MSGEIPPELGGLTNLRELSLVSNELSGEIPPELGALTNLQYLTLWGNELSGEIPPELGDLTNLIGLRIGFNPNLTGPIPRQLLQLRLPILNLMATAVCVPLDEEFQEWLATISLRTPSGAICGRLPEAMTSIDVAVFYTPAARRRAGGTAEIEAKIDLLVAETNQAYEDSGVNLRIVLAAREEVPYEEENESGHLAIHRLAREPDGLYGRGSRDSRPGRRRPCSLDRRSNGRGRHSVPCGCFWVSPVPRAVPVRSRTSWGTTWDFRTTGT